MPDRRSLPVPDVGLPSGVSNPLPVVRPATPGDASAINDIINHYILSSTTTFLLTPQTLDERLTWFASRSARHPAVVAEADGTIVGWAALSSFRPKAAYDGTAEVAVYVRHDAQRRGIGRALVTALVEQARASGFHTIVAGICSESTASIALFEHLGFMKVAHFREVGRKFGRWLDVEFYEGLL